MAETNALTVFIYVGVVLACTLLAVSMEKRPGRLKLFFCILVAALVAGLRAKTVGNDTMGYFRMFESYGQWGFIREPAFLLYIKVFMGLTHDAQACIFITSFITNGLIMAGFWKLHDHVSFPSMIFAYMCIPYFLTLSGIRQWLSLSIVCYGFHFLLEKKNLKFLFTVMIAVLFHYSSIVSVTFLGVAILLSNTGKLNTAKVLRNIVVLVVCGATIAAGYVLVNSEYQSYIDVLQSESRTGMMTYFRFLIFGLFVVATVLANRKKRNQMSLEDGIEAEEGGGDGGMDKLITMLTAVGYMLWMTSAFASQFLLNLGRTGWAFLISEGLMFSRFSQTRSNLHKIGKYAMIFIFLYTLYTTITMDGNMVVPYRFYWMR